MSHIHKLVPWIVLNRKLKGLPGQLKYCNDAKLQSSCSLVTIFCTPAQLSSIISNFEISKQSEDQVTLVYLSENMSYGNHKYRIAYVPHNKSDHQTAQCFSDILRQLSDIVISDINYSGIHRLKDRELLQNRQFVITGGKDIYKVGFGQNKIELIKRIQSLFWVYLEEINILSKPIKITNLQLLAKSLKKYTNAWEWLLSSQKNWAIFGCFVYQYYRVQQWLLTQSPKWQQTRKQGKMLSTFQLQLLHQDLLGSSHSNSSFQQTIFRVISQQIIEDIKKQNSQHMFKHLGEMRQHFTDSSVKNIQQINMRSENIAQVINLYGIPPQFVGFVIFPKEKQLMQKQMITLRHQNSELNKKIVLYQQNSLEKCSKIKDYQTQLEHLQMQLQKFKDIEGSLSQYHKQLQKQKNHTTQLNFQLQSRIFLQRKSLELKVELQSKILIQKRQKQSLLQCLQQLTQQNLRLITSKDQLLKEIHQLKQSLQDSNQIQLRALRSIQNQAQIKTRLYRYQKYVSELKLSLQAYKKIQSQKFNYILSQNYKQYEKLQNQFNETCKSLRKEQLRNKQLSDTLQRERMRLNYFEKIFINNYQNQTIPECSEENSATDRQSNQAAVQ